MISHEGVHQVVYSSKSLSFLRDRSCQSLVVKSVHPVTSIEGNKADLMKTPSLEEK